MIYELRNKLTDANISIDMKNNYIKYADYICKFKDCGNYLSIRSYSYNKNKEEEIRIDRFSIDKFILDFKNKALMELTIKHENVEIHFYKNYEIYHYQYFELNSNIESKIYYEGINKYFKSYKLINYKIRFFMYYDVLKISILHQFKGILK